MGKARRTILNTLFLCLFAAGFSASANGQKKLKDVEVISFGIFAHSPDNGKSWINPISDKKIEGITASPVHLISTRTIPAQFPLFFGFEYNLNNLKGSLTELTTEVSHPKIKQADGSFETQYKTTQKFLVLDGKITATNGYLMENKNEITKGEWTFKIMQKGKTIITQRFTVK